jgi:uncharacterized protein
MKYFTGCTALITGASSGIGYELARQLASEAATLVLVARRSGRLESLERELVRINPQLIVRSRSVDLADERQIDTLVEWIHADGLKIDVLINNAGLGDRGDFSGAEWGKIKRILDVNITALTKLTYLLLPMLREVKGAVIMNISSIVGSFPVPNIAVYAASKAYVTSFSEALRAELRHSDVVVTTVCPGPVETEFGLVAERKGAALYNVPELFTVPVEQVAHEALTAAANDRARVVPGLLVAVAMACICALPLFVLRIFLNRSAR